jgi:hypothetical protein
MDLLVLPSFKQSFLTVCLLLCFELPLRTQEQLLSSWRPHSWCIMPSPAQAWLWLDHGPVYGKAVLALKLGSRMPPPLCTFVPRFGHVVVYGFASFSSRFSPVCIISVDPFARHPVKFIFRRLSPASWALLPDEMSLSCAPVNHPHLGNPLLLPLR